MVKLSVFLLLFIVACGCSSDDSSSVTSKGLIGYDIEIDHFTRLAVNAENKVNGILADQGSNRRIKGKVKVYIKDLSGTGKAETLGDSIYVDPSVFDWPLSDQIKLMEHETAHRLQYDCGEYGENGHVCGADLATYLKWWLP